MRKNQKLTKEEVKEESNIKSYLIYF